MSEPTPGNDTVTATEPVTEQPPSDAPLQPQGAKALEEWKKRARDAERNAKQMDARLRELEDRDKTEAQRLTDQLTSAVTRAEAAETLAARLRVAVAKGLPADLAERLRGTTEEELAADADTLLALLAPKDTATAATPGPRPDMTQGGAPTASSPLNGDPLMRDVKAKLGLR